MNATRIEICTICLAFAIQVVVCFLFFWQGITNQGSLKVGVILFFWFLIFDILTAYSTKFFKK